VVAGAAPIRGGGGAGDRADGPPGGLGSPGLAGTGAEGLTNSLVGLRPRYRDRRQENGGRGCSGRARVTPAEIPTAGRGNRAC
jgi:hypothetical protein